MAMRITGLVSGMDTDSMVQELVKASSAKKEKLEKAQTKLEWKQEAWQDLNTKLLSFFTKQLDNLKYASAYKKKKTTVSDETIASVTANADAVDGTQTLAVKRLAKTGYLTGGRLSDDKSVTASTTLGELSARGSDGTIGDDDKVVLQIRNGEKMSTLELSGSSTINDVIKGLKSAGLTASFDETNQRIFVSAGASGKAGDFSINAGNVNGLNALSSLGLLEESDLKEGSATYDRYQYWEDAYDEFGALDEEKFKEKVKETTAQKATELLGNLDDLEAKVTELQNAKSKQNSAEGRSKNYLDADAAIRELSDAINVLRDYYDSVLASDGLTEDERAAAQAGRDRVTQSSEVASAAVDAYSEYGMVMPTVASYSLERQIEDESREYAEAAHKALTDPQVKASGTAVRIQGQDALISVNGAEFESDTNNFVVNGLTITATAESAVTGADAEGNPVYAETMITTSDDIDAIYDVIKNFFKEYNDLIKEMDTLYNADSAKGYEPLTDEEKDALSDKEIEKWEQKIKDSVLRKDSDLNSLISMFKTSMLGSYTVNGQKYSLSSFGINTMSYFLSGENEKGMYHIDGDADDSSTAGNADKLKAMIASDPDAVVGFFTSLIGGLQSKFNEAMQSTDYRSYQKLYDDKRLKNEYDAYTKKIADQETKLQKLEDRYYNQFSRMESALSKLNSQQSYLSSLFG